MAETIESVQELSADPHCVFELIRPRIRTMRVMVVDNLIAEVDQYSDAARREADFHAGRWVRLERAIASMALANIENNIRKLVRDPEIRTFHLSEINGEAVRKFDPDAIILGGTLRDFDHYAPHLIEGFNQFIHEVNVPVLAICGGHQMVGQAFGAKIRTIDGRPPAEARSGRMIEYQYRFVKITDLSDPIFVGVQSRTGLRWQKYTSHRHLLRVWQNHGLEIDRLPEGFTKLARGYLSEIQMIVRRTAQQLIYGVQFHLEKSFQDWQADKYWDHRNESRDGRLLFDNFLVEALKFRAKTGNLLEAGELGLGAAGGEPGAVADISGLPATGF